MTQNQLRKTSSIKTHTRKHPSGYTEVVARLGDLNCSFFYHKKKLLHVVTGASYAAKMISAEVPNVTVKYTYGGGSYFNGEQTVPRRNIGEVLKLVRLHRCMRQAVLANKLSICVSFLSMLERGGRTVTYEMLEKYSNVLSIPISAIVLLVNGSVADIEAEIALATEQAKRIARWD